MSNPSAVPGDMILVDMDSLPFILDKCRKGGVITAKEFLDKSTIPIDSIHSQELARAAFNYCGDKGVSVKIIRAPGIEDIVLFEKNVLSACLREFCYLIQKGNITFVSFSRRPPIELVNEFKRNNPFFNKKESGEKTHEDNKS